MKRLIAVVAALLAAIGWGDRLPPASASDIISETTAAQHGLTRPWFTQIELDRGRTRLRDMVLYEDVLYLVTSRAMVHAIDAQTGQTLWAKQIGEARHPSMTPGLNRDWLVILNGTRLFACNRHNGNLLYERKLEGTPAAGPAVSDRRAYVPMISGMVLAYRLTPLVDPNEELGKDAAAKPSTAAEGAAVEAQRREDVRMGQEHGSPLSCQSFGRALIQPVVIRQSPAEEIVIWPTDRGYLNIGRIDRNREDRFGVKARLETDDVISAPPTYLPPDPKLVGDSGLVFTVSEDGFVYAILEKNGQLLWRFSTGEPIVQPAVVIEEQVYVATQPGGMYCLDAKTGGEMWFAPQISEFLAASKDRLYVADKMGRILILSVKTGARLAVLPAPQFPFKLVNADTDRIYLATATGLVQCLHEREHPEPIRHGEARKKAAQQALPSEETVPAAPNGKPKPAAKTGGAVTRPPAKPTAKPADDAGDPFAEGAAAGAPPAKPAGPAKKPAGAKRPPAKKPTAKKPAPADAGLGAGE